MLNGAKVTKAGPTAYIKRQDEVHVHSLCPTFSICFKATSAKSFQGKGGFEKDEMNEPSANDTKFILLSLSAHPMLMKDFLSLQNHQFSSIYYFLSPIVFKALIPIPCQPQINSCHVYLTAVLLSVSVSSVCIS